MKKRRKTLDLSTGHVWLVGDYGIGVCRYTFSSTVRVTMLLIGKGRHMKLFRAYQLGRSQRDAFRIGDGAVVDAVVDQTCAHVTIHGVGELRFTLAEGDDKVIFEYDAPLEEI